MIYGVVGTLDRDTMMKFGLFNMKTGRFTRVASKKGNGKTMVLTYYGYRENKEQNRKVYSNFHTKFSIYRTAQEIFDDLGRILDLAGKFGAYGTVKDIMKNFDHIFAKYPLKPIEQTELYELRALYIEYYGSFILLTEFQKFFNSLGTSTKTVKWVEGIMTQLRKLEIDIMWDSQRPISAGNRTREYTETYLIPQKFHYDDECPCDKDICEKDHFIKVFCDVPFREEPLVILNCAEVGKLYETDEIIGDVLCAPQEKDNDAKELDKQKRRKRKEEPPAPIPVITNRVRDPKDLPADDELGIYVEETTDNDTQELIRIIGDINDTKEIKESDLLDDPTQDELERMILEAIPGIPVVIKSLLPVYHKEGKIHDLYLIYFNEDGSLKKEEGQGIT